MRFSATYGLVLDIRRVLHICYQRRGAVPQWDVSWNTSPRCTFIRIGDAQCAYESAASGKGMSQLL